MKHQTFNKQKVCLEIVTDISIDCGLIEEIVKQALNEKGIKYSCDMTGEPIWEEEKSDNYNFYKEDEYKISILSTQELPDGWEWQCYKDGSGSLVNVNEKKHYFSYDLQPYANQNGIEFKKTEKDHYDIYWGTFENFRKFAESVVKERILSIHNEAEQERE